MSTPKLTAHKSPSQQNPGTTELSLIGVVDETADFPNLVGPVEGTLRVNCKEIARINSVGVKNWIKYFQELSKAKVKLIFAECSTSITEQLNLIANFTAGGTVESVYVPYACTNCKNEMIALFSTETLREKDLDLPEITCSKCGSPAVFDDLEEEYFHFLDRNS